MLGGTKYVVITAMHVIIRPRFRVSGPQDNQYQTTINVSKDCECYDEDKPLYILRRDIISTSNSMGRSEI